MKKEDFKWERLENGYKIISYNGLQVGGPANIPDERMYRELERMIQEEGGK